MSGALGSLSKGGEGDQGYSKGLLEALHAGMGTGRDKTKCGSVKGGAKVGGSLSRTAGGDWNWNGCGEVVWWGGVCGEKGVEVEDDRGCRKRRVRLRCGGRQARFW